VTREKCERSALSLHPASFQISVMSEVGLIDRVRRGVVFPRPAPDAGRESVCSLASLKSPPALWGTAVTLLGVNRPSCPGDCSLIVTFDLILFEA
jgi:hypothetical protein